MNNPRLLDFGLRVGENIGISDFLSSLVADKICSSAEQKLAESIQQRQAGFLFKEKELSRLVDFQEHVVAFRGDNKVKAAKDNPEPCHQAKAEIRDSGW